ncbi:transcriptional regulator, LuxR family [Jannaschia faecimaris]|uniref:Transcriptional regulator, LuxR family n=1 Tax=Jannaschia faecimaris TaxID=1244108 RepID=A0A1H3TM61_9RHOB|nr:helix-turn-helix transcriptional regulator [Jannaschia faecimaris]SDZ50958.1 transcriptional regulator, LuxR family [Jannaschia faecimaris]
MSAIRKSFSAEQTRGSVKVVAKFVHAVDLGGNFQLVLAGLQGLVGSDSVKIVRQMRHFDRTRIMARHEKAVRMPPGKASCSLGSELLGDLLHTTNLGSVLCITEVNASIDARDKLDQFGLREVVTLSLCTERDFSDFLEFQFERPLLEHNRQLLEILGSVLSQSWLDRAPGVAAMLLARQPCQNSEDREPKFANVLSVQNPAGLTRSEYRICMLVQEGRLPDKLSEILQISKSTFRSHMRSIFLKTGVSGHLELVHLLHQSGNQTRDGLQMKAVQR